MTLNEHLAINVMGWHKDRSDLGINEFGNKESPWNYADKDGIITACIHMWRPTESIEQAMMCLDKCHESNIHTTVHFTDCWVHEKGKLVGKATDKSRTMAISLACARATGWSK